MFWAKSSRIAPDAYLSLEDHLYDVAEVAGVLLRRRGTASRVEWLAHALGAEVNEAEAMVRFLAASHDIGKANPGFQRLVPALAEIAVPPELIGEIAGFPSNMRFRHDAVSGAALVNWLINAGLGPRRARDLAATISGHHGTPRPRNTVDRIAEMLPEVAPRFTAEQARILDQLAETLGAPVGELSERISAVGILWIAGLITVADWIGSDQRYFPVLRDGEFDRHEAAVRAAGDSLGTEFEIQRTEFKAFTGFEPNSTQSAVIHSAARVGGDPALYIVESRTGSGKTEAAMAVVAEALAAGAPGFYIALPTKATANQMFQRTSDFVERLGSPAGPALRLLHSDAARALATLQPELSRMEAEEGESDLSPQVEAERWLTGKGRRLLAPFAVGTIDQVLPLAMNVKHYPVLMWSLAGKVVVLDEVHAYDSYTSALLKSMVEWLGALGSTVVILSATLPSSKRSELLGAFSKGAGFDIPDDVSAIRDTAYPRLSVASKSDSWIEAVEDGLESRTVTIEKSDLADEPELLAKAIVDDLSDAGCVGVVCSTVKLAQQRFLELKANADADTELLLLHSRLRPIERAGVEARLIDALSKSSARRPVKMVVVATQIVEQSLDIDFDLLFTDLAPIDLLVQRAGRLHRHQNDRSQRHATRRMVLLDTVGASAVRPLAESVGYVYEPFVLYRTRMLMAGRDRFTEPDDLDEMIEFVYESEDRAELLTDTEREVYEKSRGDLNRNTDVRTGAAAKWSLISPHDEDRVWDAADAFGYARSPFAGKDFRLAPSTRAISGPQVEVVVLTGDESEVLNRPVGPSEIDYLTERCITVGSPALAKALLRSAEADAPEDWNEIPQLRDKLLLYISDERLNINLFSKEPSFNSVLGLA